LHYISLGWVDELVGRYGKCSHAVIDDSEIICNRRDCHKTRGSSIDSKNEALEGLAIRKTSSACLGNQEEASEMLQKKFWRDFLGLSRVAGGEEFRKKRKNTWEHMKNRENAMHKQKSNN